MDNEKPNFTVSIFLPPLIYGPTNQYVDSVEKLNFSDKQLYSVMNSAASENGTVPNTAFPGFVCISLLPNEAHDPSLTY